MIKGTIGDAHNQGENGSEVCILSSYEMKGPYEPVDLSQNSKLACCFATELLTLLSLLQDEALGQDLRKADF